MGHDPTALRDALLGVQEAFAQAGRRRVATIRDLARAEVGDGEAPALRALVEALLRREAGDADETLPLAERVARAGGEAARAPEARAQLDGQPEVQRLSAEIDATWQEALRRSDVLDERLPGHVAPEIAEAFADYVGALRALHTDGAAATGTYAAALHRLNRATGFTG